MKLALLFISLILLTGCNDHDDYCATKDFIQINNGGNLETDIAADTDVIPEPVTILLFVFGICVMYGYFLLKPAFNSGFCKQCRLMRGDLIPHDCCDCKKESKNDIS